MLKRTFDWFVSFLVILIALPIWMTVAIAIKLDSPGISVNLRGLGQSQAGINRSETVFAFGVLPYAHGQHQVY